ncbi:TetR/AcrR family transcriptional regulator [Prauserella cavernicola]|uniref:TetR/AcrR family transcriptional regulator n=1 Tax=Prauserella cavernicola TaxID=2800127 RepID=A0A934V1M2_9PSEU|nr:TetR/AcrR family transcriptional regulator [Prauserella cavernicola]MBK1783506.1 TetR/AcrR family transcriptional regulator [Prauserella cavernicola]
MPSPASSRIDGRTTRWAGQRERRRREFVEAALRAIAHHGPGLPIERIAEEAGVARTRLYKHFADASDIHRAIASRVVELLNAELAPLWNLHGSPREMIAAAIDTHTRFLSERRHLYLYLGMYALSQRDPDGDAVNDVKTTIGQHLTRLFEYYLTTFGLRTLVAQPVAFGLVGMVDATVARWLDEPSELRRDELVGLLSRWVWAILDDTLRSGGVELDPDAGLSAPDLPFP